MHDLVTKWKANAKALREEAAEHRRRGNDQSFHECSAAENVFEYCALALQRVLVERTRDLGPRIDTPSLGIGEKGQGSPEDDDLGIEEEEEEDDELEEEAAEVETDSAIFPILEEE